MNETLESLEPRGATYDKSIDGPRLAKQKMRVATLMLDGKWRTLREIAGITGDPEASVSARLRDLRRINFRLNTRRAGDPTLGRYEYQVVPA